MRREVSKYAAMMPERIKRRRESASPGANGVLSSFRSSDEREFPLPGDTGRDSDPDFSPAPSSGSQVPLAQRFAAKLFLATPLHGSYPSANGLLFRGIHLHSAMPRKYSPVIGRAMSSMVMGSAVGVMIIAATKMISTASRHLAR